MHQTMLGSNSSLLQAMPKVGGCPEHTGVAVVFSFVTGASKANRDSGPGDCSSIFSTTRWEKRGAERNPSPPSIVRQPARKQERRGSSSMRDRPSFQCQADSAGLELGTSLKDKSKAEIYCPWRLGARNYPCRCTSDRGIGLAPIRMVEEVEEFHPKLHIGPLIQSGLEVSVLEKRKVPLSEARS